MAWFARKPAAQLSPPVAPARKPGAITKVLTAAGLAPPVNHELVEWTYDPEKRAPVARFVNGPPPEPPGLRPKSYHSAFADPAQPRSWLFPDGMPGGSWWARRS
jgi:hypothetical protein